MYQRDPASRVAILRLVLQRGEHADCAIATLASYLGVSYEEALLAANAATRNDVLRTGLHGSDMVRAAKRLGVTLKSTQWDRVDQDDDTGILFVMARIHGQTYEEHCVIFHQGSIIDLRDGTLWASDVYYRHFAADPTHLLKAA